MDGEDEDGSEPPPANDKPVKKVGHIACCLGSAGRPSLQPSLQNIDTYGHVQAAAAMVVGVGSLSDPHNMQGLSHYLEHMLFMGSEQFPDENDYDSFLSKNGGGSNAYTELVCSAASPRLGKYDYSNRKMLTAGAAHA